MPLSFVEREREERRDKKMELGNRRREKEWNRRSKPRSREINCQKMGRKKRGERIKKKKKKMKFNLIKNKNKNKKINNK